MTTRRMSAALGASTQNFPFCGETDGDSTEQRDSCEFLRQCRLQLFCDDEGDAYMHGIDPWTPDQLWLQEDLTGGRALQQMLAYLYAAHGMSAHAGMPNVIMFV